jgi:hypothetical protein
MCCPSDFLEGEENHNGPFRLPELNYTSQRYDAGMLTAKPCLIIGLLMDHNIILSFDDQVLGNISPF